MRDVTTALGLNWLANESTLPSHTTCAGDGPSKMRVVEALPSERSILKNMELLWTRDYDGRKA